MAISNLKELRRLVLLALADGQIKEVITRYFDDFESSVRARIELNNRTEPIIEIAGFSGVFKDPLNLTLLEVAKISLKIKNNELHRLLGEAEGKGRDER